MAAFTNREGIFALYDVRLRQNSGYWASIKPYGYFSSGNTGPTVVSTIDRIDYSNDTATALVRGPQSSSRFLLAAAGNSSYGWFGGGSGFSTRVDRLDYNNDTETASIRGPLAIAMSYSAATGSQFYGYWGGGYTPGPNIQSSVNRIDYSNDTATAAPKGPLSSPRCYLSATGNQSYGYFGCGAGFPIAPNTRSIVDRIDYANDTATASPKGPLSLARYYLTATGNSSYGWFGGGYSSISRVDRVDYSNDTATASIRGNLNLSKYGMASTGSPSF